MAEDCPKMAQIGPKMAQDGPKMAQDGPKMAQDGPRWPQDGHKMAQEAKMLVLQLFLLFSRPPRREGTRPGGGNFAAFLALHVARINNY